MPQPPPPPKLGAFAPDELLSVPEAQLKAEIIFFTSLDEHMGHSALLGSG